MGHLHYSSVAQYEFEDRALAHYKLAISVKLRQQESFFVSWPNPNELGGGRVSIWLSPNIPILFKFAGSRPPEINPVWVDVLRDLSNTPRGMLLITEAEAKAYADAKASRAEATPVKTRPGSSSATSNS